MALWGCSWGSVGGPGPLLGPMLAVLGCSWASAGSPRSLLGPILAVLGCYWGLCWRSWAPMLAVLGRSWGLCGRKYEEHVYFENVLISQAGARSAASRAVLGRSWTLCWRSWAALGAYVGDLGPLLVPMLAVLGCSWGLCWRSWAALGGVESLLGHMLAVLGRLGPKNVKEYEYLKNVIIFRVGARSAAWGSVLSCSWGLCWRSWAALGAYVGGPGPLIGPLLPVS